MTYNSKRLFNKEEHGDPYELIENSLNLLMSKAKQDGFDAQIRASWLVEGTTRYARSQVTQHTDINSILFNLKLVKGKRFATASSSILTENGLVALFNQVSKNLMGSPEVEFFQGLPDPKNSSNVDLSGTTWSIEERADNIIELVNAGEEVSKDVILAGTLIENRKYQRIISTQGVDNEDSVQKNYFKVNAICGEPEQRGYGQEEFFWRYKKPDFTSLTRSATQTALDTINVMTMEPKEYEVLLGPQAVADLMVYVLFSSDAVSFHESNSFTADRLGDQVFDKKLHIENVPRDPKQVINTVNFDLEGMSTENQIFIDEGVLKFVAYNSFFAAKYLDDKNLNSGLSMSLPWGPATIPMSASVKPGNKLFEEQIRDIDDGLLVNNFWYNRFTLRREGGLTGLTRNGLFHVKNGEIQGAVRNLRYTESFVRAFGEGNIRSISKDRRMFFMSTCPSIHLERYNFSSLAHTNK